MCKRDYWGKSRAFVEINVLKGLSGNLGILGENGAFDKNKCEKGTLW